MKIAATTQPAKMPASGAHNRNIPDPFREIITEVPRVAATTKGLAINGVPVGTTANLSTATAMTDIEINMSDVPQTTGVMILLNSGSHAANAN